MSTILKEKDIISILVKLAKASHQEEQKEMKKGHMFDRSKNSVFHEGIKFGEKIAYLNAARIIKRNLL